MMIRTCNHCQEPIERTPATENATTRVELIVYDAQLRPITGVEDYHEMCWKGIVAHEILAKLTNAEYRRVEIARHSTYI